MIATRPLWPLLALLVLFGAVGAVAADGDEYAGSETCAACHDEVAARMSRTAHAVAPGWNAETACESCHGPGAEHADSGGDTDLIVRLGELPPREASAPCVACHDKQPSPLKVKHSIHRLGDVGCADCHSPHSTEERMLERTGRDLCQDCHQAIASQFDLARSHPTKDCSDCHDPHASRALRTDTTAYREVCVDCHFDKEGPYFYDHEVMTVDGCASCHAVHGSANRHLLKHEPQVNLCYQCHSAAVTPGWHSVPRFLNEKCTACHTAIHGSNTNPFFLEE